MSASAGTARHPHEELLRRSARAAFAGAVRRLRELSDDDVVLHLPGRAAQRGNAAIARLAALGAARGSEFHDALANDEHGVILQEIRGERDGRPLAVRCAIVHHFRAGKIAEVWVHADDVEALEVLTGDLATEGGGGIGRTTSGRDRGDAGPA